MFDAPPPARLYFDAVLTPHRSLSAAGFRVLMACLCGVSATAGTAFLMAGAWPVFGFFGFDVLLVYVAFRLSYRAARLRETVRLDDRELVVRRLAPDGGAREWRFQAYWLRVQFDHHPARHDSALTLTSHGRSLVIGAFLAPHERKSLAQSLRQALERQRAFAAP